MHVGINGRMENPHSVQSLKAAALEITEERAVFWP